MSPRAIRTKLTTAGAQRSRDKVDPGAECMRLHFR